MATKSPGRPTKSQPSSPAAIRLISAPRQGCGGEDGCAGRNSDSLVLAGSALLLLGERSGVWQVAATCFLIGLGMGLTASPMLIAAQSGVGWAERGLVTGTNIFLRVCHEC